MQHIFGDQYKKENIKLFEHTETILQCITGETI